MVLSTAAAAEERLLSFIFGKLSHNLDDRDAIPNPTNPTTPPSPNQYLLLPFDGKKEEDLLLLSLFGVDPNDNISTDLKLGPMPYPPIQ